LRDQGEGVADSSVALIAQGVRLFKKLRIRGNPNMQTIALLIQYAYYRIQPQSETTVPEQLQTPRGV